MQTLHAKKREREVGKAGTNEPNKKAHVGDKAAPTWTEIMEQEGIDVQELLNRKLKSGKFDVKGRNAEMLVLLRQFKACVRHMNDQTQELEEEIQRSKEELDTLAESHKNDLNIAKEESNKLQEKIEEVKQQAEGYQQQLKEAEKNIAELKSAIADKEEAIKNLEYENKHQETDNKKLALEAQQAKEEINKLQELNKQAQEYASGLQEYNSKLQDEATAMQLANNKLQEEKAELSQELASSRGQLEAMQMQLKSTQDAVKVIEESKASAQEDASKLRAELTTLQEERTAHLEELKQARGEIERFKQVTGQTAEEMAEAQAKAKGLQAEYKSQQDIIAELRRQLEVVRHQKELTESICSEKAGDLQQIRGRITHLEESLADAERRVLEGEALRKKLHNTILELKGNIRVFCRVRALGTEEESCEETAVVNFPSETEEQRGKAIDIVMPRADEGKPSTTYNFSFDRVFDPQATQEHVFEEITQLVQSALDGYKVSIFAYGQTGSGKTYTMFGPDAMGDEAGMIPRSILQIFESSAELSKRGWQFNMGASMLEIYNEDIVDLLGKKLPAGKSHQIQHDNKGNTNITDMTVVEVTHPGQVEKLMKRATNARSVGSTNLNERSSRSHCVFRLTIDGTNSISDQQVHGVLNLIDLAGSERLAKSGAVGERLKETQAINKSLSALGDVISALNEQSAHIPYRNSKLTYLLQPCLGGDSKTLMFVNLNPRTDAASESLCSLRFAAKVNACEVGTARRNTGKKK